MLYATPDGFPRRFRWRGRSYRVAAADGPERVYGEWWRRASESACVRDYFQVLGVPHDADGFRRAVDEFAHGRAR